MKHMKNGFDLKDLSDVYHWLMTESQLYGDYMLIRGLVKTQSYSVLQRLIAESAYSLLTREYFSLQDNRFVYIA
jgi:hypothetical protein